MLLAIYTRGDQCHLPFRNSYASQMYKALNCSPIPATVYLSKLEALLFRCTKSTSKGMLLANMLIKVTLMFGLCVSAWSIPKHQPEGAYLVRVDANGAETHTPYPIGNVAERSLSSPSSKFAVKRDLTGRNEVTCSGVAFSKTPADEAYQGLLAACPADGVSVPWSYDLYYNVNGGVAYFCNVKGFGASNTCYGGIYFTFHSNIGFLHFKWAQTCEGLILSLLHGFTEYIKL